MKRTAIMAAIALAVATPASAVYASGGIPTLDINSVKQLNALLDQLETAKSQLEQTRAQLQALTQSSGFGYVLNNPGVQDAIRASLPADASALIDRLQGQNVALSGAVDSIIAGIDDPVDFQRDGRALGEKSLRIAATKKALTEQAYNAMTKRLEIIDGLQAKINETTNPKEIAELQARIAIEQANIQADQTRIGLAEQQFAAERELLAARSERVYKGWFSGRSSASKQ
ncbi:type IV secretion system protein [Alcaligenaceae bacterium]|nr:type IV secretion system protein [Alcaligenaceae bacterium]